MADDRAPGGLPPPGGPGAGSPGLPFLPPGVRIVLYYLVVVALPASVVRLAVERALGPTAFPPVDSGAQVGLGPMLLLQALTLPWIVAATWIYLRRVDGKPWSGIGVRLPRVLDLLLPPLAAGLLLVSWVGVASLGARLSLGPAATPAPARQLGVVAGGLLLAAVLEEGVLRGYIFSTLRERWSWVHAGGLSAVVMALPYLAVEGVPPGGLVNVFLIGLIHAALRELSGGIWASALFASSWNFLTGCIASLPVSGFRFPSLHHGEATGPAGWTGGAWGPEGSWSLSALLLVGVVVLAALLDRRAASVPAVVEGEADGAPDVRK